MGTDLESGIEDALGGITYKIQKSEHPPVSWRDYAHVMDTEWQRLRSDAAAKEIDYQRFFETHPSFLAATQRVFDGADGHGPFPSALVSQPVLPAYSWKVPDFLWIMRNSAKVCAVLVEIEDPHKGWATQKGQPTAEFTQALDQIAEWKTWFADPLNSAKFQQLYRIPGEWQRSRIFQQRYVLVYGTRRDPSLTEAVSRKRAQRERADEIHMTFDRLTPDRMLRDCSCARVDENGYRAISVSPSLRLGPMGAENRALIREKEEAVRLNPYLPEQRKQFLISRLPYWDSWARTASGIRRTDDWE
jgi:Shedu protein SduA, C-terminal